MTRRDVTVKKRRFSLGALLSPVKCFSGESSRVKNARKLQQQRQLLRRNAMTSRANRAREDRYDEQAAQAYLQYMQQVRRRIMMRAHEQQQQQQQPRHTNIETSPDLSSDQYSYTMTSVCWSSPRNRNFSSKQRTPRRPSPVVRGKPPLPPTQLHTNRINASSLLQDTWSSASPSNREASSGFASPTASPILACLDNVTQVNLSAVTDVTRVNTTSARQNLSMHPELCLHSSLAYPLSSTLRDAICENCSVSDVTLDNSSDLSLDVDDVEDDAEPTLMYVEPEEACSARRMRREVASSDLHSDEQTSLSPPRATRPDNSSNLRSASSAFKQVLPRVRSSPEGASQSFIEASKMAAKQAAAGALQIKTAKRKSMDSSIQSEEGNAKKRLKRRAHNPKRLSDVIEEDENKENDPRSLPVANKRQYNDVIRPSSSFRPLKASGVSRRILL